MPSEIGVENLFTRNSRGIYSIITSPWPRVLPGVPYEAILINGTLIWMRSIDQGKHD